MQYKIHSSAQPSTGKYLVAAVLNANRLFLEPKYKNNDSASG